MSAYNIIDTWLDAGATALRHPHLGRMYRSSQARVRSGQCRLIDAQYVADYAKLESSLHGDALSAQFASVMQPVVSPWENFVLTFNDETRDFLGVGISFPYSEAGASHPDYPNGVFLSIEWYYRFGGLWIPFGVNFISNFDQVGDADGRFSLTSPTSEVRVSARTLQAFGGKFDALTMHLLMRSGRVAIMTLVFATARNAREEEVPMTRAERRRSTLPPSIRFSRVAIDPMRRHRRSDTESATADVPWHMVRGHFAYYSPERPLFGRPGLHGRYWISEHERGDREHGEVHKDYTVLPGTDEAT